MLRTGLGYLGILDSLFVDIVTNGLNSATGSWMISTDPLLFESKPHFASSVSPKPNPVQFD